MPLDDRCSLDAFKSNIRELIGAGKERKQALAIAYDTLRKACLSPEAAKRAEREQWTPKEIVGEDIELNPSELPKWVVAMAVESLSEEDAKLLKQGLKELSEERRSLNMEQNERLAKDDEEDETLSAEDIEAKLLDYMAEAVTVGLAEYFKELDYDRLKTRDIANMVKSVSNVLYRLSRRFPTLARKDLLILRAKGPGGFLRWFRSRLMR